MCGTRPGGFSLEGVDLSTQAVIRGTVNRGGEAASPAYVRLLDSGGEFTAEVPTGPGGEFVFFAAPGRWTLRTLAPGVDPVDRVVVAELGTVAEVEVALSG